MFNISVVRARDYSRDQDYDAFTVVRLFNGHIRSLGGRHAWVKICTDNKRIYRRIRGGANLGLAGDSIELDYDSRLELGIESPRGEDGFHPCSVVISPASFFGKIMAHWQNPNIEYRVSYRLAILSVVLGFVGLILGVISILC